MIDCGAGIQISKEAVAEIEMYQQKFSGRVNALKKNFWPNKQAQLTDKNLPTNGIVIPHVNLKSMRSKFVSVAYPELMFYFHFKFIRV